MSELFASIKAFIEKGNLIIFLLSLASAIFTYQVFAKEMLWAAFAFCISYPIFIGIHTLYDNYCYNAKIAEEQRKNEETEKLNRKGEEARQKKEKEKIKVKMRTIYASLTDDVKDGLIALYNLPKPEGGYDNVRIVHDYGSNDYQLIVNAYSQILMNIGGEYLLESQHSTQSQIITIKPIFYDILAEEAKKRKKAEKKK